MDDPSTSGVEGFGLLDYNARFYDPTTGRFAQADTIVPGGVQGLDRYAYTNNSPVNYVDPSGHLPGKGDFVNYKLHVRKGMEKYYESAGELRGLTPEMERTFWYFWSMNPAAAIAWLAHEFGITLPPGDTWAYITGAPSDKYGITPDKTGIIIDETGLVLFGGKSLDDQHVYITDSGIKRAQTGSGTDLTILLVFMLHESGHAWIEDRIETALKKNELPEFTNLRDADLFGAIAMEMAADEAARAHAKYGIVLSDGARLMLQTHYDGLKEKYKGCHGCGSPTDYLISIYGVTRDSFPPFYDSMYGY